MDSKILQSPRAHKRRCSLEGSRNRGKTAVGFDLNAIPDEPLPLDFVSLTSTTDETQQGSASRETNTHVDVDAVRPTIELIDVEASAAQAANLPIDVNDSAVQWANELIDIEASVDQPVIAAIDVEAGTNQPASELIDVELVDDNIMIFSSPRGLPQVQNQPVEAVPDMIVLDEESDVNAGSPGAADEELSTRLTLSVYPLRRASNHGNMENNQIAMSVANSQTKNVATSPEPQNEEPKEPTFTCPVCWGPFFEEYSTICGHVFCHTCIKASIKAQKKCPTCRKKLNKRNIHRVYLPTAI